MIYKSLNSFSMHCFLMNIVAIFHILMNYTIESLLFVK